MKYLTEKDINEMTQEQRVAAYDKAVDDGCNLEPASIEFDMAHHNQGMLERKLIYKEF